MADNVNTKKKSVADPLSAYDALAVKRAISRAACRGQEEIKAFDSVVDTLTFSNLLIPFSDSMSEQQFRFFKAEAEWPGIVSQYAKLLVGGLLRKQPSLELPEGVPEDAKDWILNEFGQDGSPISHFLDEALWDEIQTSWEWVYIDYPVIENPDELTQKEFLEYKPYPILWPAEAVINWTMTTDKKGRSILSRVITKFYEEVEDPDNEFHNKHVEVVKVHEVVDDVYRVRVYTKDVDATGDAEFELTKVIPSFMMQGKPLSFIPAWPLNGSYTPLDPILLPLIHKEIALYNKVSRRNHLLYGASTYTPVIASDMSDEEFDDIVNSGLGSWLKIKQGDTATVLDTPTAALTDMDRAIASSIEEMAKLGIRMLTPETEQSGVALEIRNAAQTAQLGTFNTKVSNTMSNIIAFMLNWRYGLQLRSQDVKFTLSADFNPTPLGADWLRLATEWYENGLIPRSAWLALVKQNELLSPEYDDDEGQKEINKDELIISEADKFNYAQENMDKQNKMNNQK